MPWHQGDKEMGKKKLKKLIETTFGSLKQSEIKEGQESEANVWTASIWKLDKINLNGRVYPTTLAQRLINENKATPVCDGHEPDYHSEFINYRAVAKEPKIIDGELVVTIKVIDEKYNELLLRLLKEGIGIGVSSVGYGSCDRDGVIDDKSYELVRYCDFVTSPAGEVYAEPQDADNEDDDENEKDNDNSESESVDLPGEESVDSELAEEISRITKAREIRISRGCKK